MAPQVLHCFFITLQHVLSAHLTCYVLCSATDLWMGQRAHPGVPLRALGSLQRQLSFTIGSFFPARFIPECVCLVPSSVLQYHAPRPGAPWRSLFFANPAHVPSQALPHSLLRYSLLMLLPLFRGSKLLYHLYVNVSTVSGDLQDQGTGSTAPTLIYNHTPNLHHMRSHFGVALSSTLILSGPCGGNDEDVWHRSLQHITNWMMKQ